MMGGWQAFKSGFRKAASCWQALLALYLASLLAALILALLPGLSLLQVAHRPASAEAAGGLTAWMLVDFAGILAGMQASAGGATPGTHSDLEALADQAVLVFLALPLVTSLVTDFIYGGVLLRFVEGAQPFRWWRFFWGCWRWLGSFLLLTFLEAIVFILVFIPALFILPAAAGLSSLATAALVVLLLIVLGLMATLAELARVWAVARDTRNIFAAVGRAFLFVFEQPLALLLFYSLSLVAFLGLHAVFRLGVLAVVPMTFWPLAILAQQAFIGLRLLARAARLAGASTLVANRMGSVA